MSTNFLIFHELFCLCGLLGCLAFSKNLWAFQAKMVAMKMDAIEAQKRIQLGAYALKFWRSDALPSGGTMFFHPRYWSVRDWGIYIKRKTGRDPNLLPKTKGKR